MRPTLARLGRALANVLLWPPYAAGWLAGATLKCWTLTLAAWREGVEAGRKLK